MENTQTLPVDVKDNKSFKLLVATVLVLSFGLSIALAYFAGYYFGNLHGVKFGQNKGVEIGKEAGKRELLERRETDSNSLTALWGLINDYRKDRKLPAIKKNDLLCQLSDLRSKQIVSNWSHDYFWNNKNLLYNQYCDTCTQMGENLGKDYLDAGSLFNAWLNSPTHKKVLDTPNTMGCLSISEADEGYYVALELAR